MSPSTLTTTAPTRWYHGTSASEASVRSEGLILSDVDALVIDLATEHGASPDDIRAAMEGQYVGRRLGSRVVYLTGDKHTAASYAVGPGEAEKMILTIIYEHLHQVSEEFVDRHSPIERWIAARARDLVPIVVTVTLPPGEYLELNDASLRLPSPVPPEWVTAVEPVRECVCDHDWWHVEHACILLCPACRLNCPSGGQMPTF